MRSHHRHIYADMARRMRSCQYKATTDRLNEPKRLAVRHRMVETVLAQPAPEFGFDPANTTAYNLRYRNPALSSLTAERLQTIYANKGVQGVRKQLQLLRQNGII